MLNQSLFTSKKDDWTTPDDLFAELDDIFHFDLDACASHDNAKCDAYFTKEDDALVQDWSGYSSVYMNPPYGRDIGRFVDKAYAESLNGVTVVCLLPARTDTKWWATAKKGMVIFLPGRLRFGNAKHSAPFPSAVVIFWGGKLGEAVRPS